MMAIESSPRLSVSRQVLVRLDHAKTYLLHLQPFDSACPIANVILDSLSSRCSIPARNLRIITPPTSLVWSDSVPLISVAFFLPIRGGKGGFGTLLKGQSKQAGAKTTVDFGACRDLSGRRLRHINDEVKLRNWRNAQARREQGLPVDEVEELKTESGIRNWHLMVPGWADGAASSAQGRRRHEMAIRREVERWKSAEERDQMKKEETKRVQEQAVDDYVRAGEAAIAEQDALRSKKDVVLEFMIKKRKRRQNDGEIQSKSVSSIYNVDTKYTGGDETAETGAVSFLCTLSGDVVVEDDDKGKKVSLQSQSEFATAAVLLSRPLPAETRGLYYEVKVCSGGLAQIGWANMGDSKDVARQFRPNSDTGDGVGDDESSFAFDGYRGIVFHGGKEKSAGGGRVWKEGDIVGCQYDVNSRTVSFSLNGKGVGVELGLGDVGISSATLLYPAVSLNRGEIVQINIGPNFAFELPHSDSEYRGICDLVDYGAARGNSNQEKTEKLSIVDDQIPSSAGSGFSSRSTMILPPIALAEDVIEAKMPPPKKISKTKSMTAHNAKGPKDDAGRKQPLDLETIKSLSELKDLGMDRIKDTLLSMGCKGGGSLHERAGRLFSLKGLRREDYPKKVRGKNFSV